MPLIPQQDIVSVEALGGGPNQAIEKLRTKLEAYPEVRIVSISMKQSGIAAGVELVAVIETV